MMRATSEDVLHRPAHMVFTGANTWVVDKLQHVADTHTFDMVMSSALNFGGHTQMVNMTLLPLVTAERSKLGSMIVIEALPH